MQLRYTDANSGEIIKTDSIKVDRVLQLFTSSRVHTDIFI